MMKMKLLRSFPLATALSGAWVLAGFAVDPSGIWKTDQGTVRVYDCGGALCATAVSAKEKTDRNNVDPSKRNRPLVGVAILTGLRPQGANKWSGGQVYNPDDGKTYDANVSLEGANTLKVQGCIFIGCRTVTWTRQ